MEKIVGRSQAARYADTIYSQNSKTKIANGLSDQLMNGVK